MFFCGHFAKSIGLGPCLSILSVYCELVCLLGLLAEFDEGFRCGAYRTFPMACYDMKHYQPAASPAPSYRTSHCFITLPAQVWDSSLTDLLYVWKQPTVDKPETTHLDFVRGVAFNVPASGELQLCAGCSSGDVQVGLVEVPLPCAYLIICFLNALS